MAVGVGEATAVAVAVGVSTGVGVGVGGGVGVGLDGVGNCAAARPARPSISHPTIPPHKATRRILHIAIAPGGPNGWVITCLEPMLSCFGKSGTSSSHPSAARKPFPRPFHLAYCARAIYGLRNTRGRKSR